ncbi:MAG: hypothetical protein E7773_12150 [Sphingomonas sp.]|uniref:hypothetical protein n=1 Tax=Sphingomonas sp. TaxID=28214 RepID=UPI001220EF8E|nr:hypothetical protein [Sphingomonas sp.]THD35198.1 MAG: hypothetical protein E7773_12150 [Sphingomonas sp.]
MSGLSRKRRLIGVAAILLVDAVFIAFKRRDFGDLWAENRIAFAQLAGVVAGVAIIAGIAAGAMIWRGERSGPDA